jgi:eukaryotic-like serine/threonine-protein kinase
MNQQHRDAWCGALLGQTFGDYKTTTYLGGGGFGFVYQALQSSTGDTVALKILIPGSPRADADEFRTEGELLARLQRSSGIVTLIETNEETAEISLGGVPLPLQLQFHSMELASGCLEELLIDRNSVNWLERLKLWRGAIVGVHQMHLKKMAHRDLKSSNCLLLVRRKQETTCIVSDLGRSRDLTRPARYDPIYYLAGRGDLRFAPPEFLWWQGDETVDGHRSADLYGLGSVLFEVATGVGLTQMALGFGPDLLHTNALAASRGQTIDLGILAPKYELALDVFAEELPPVIRQEARGLLRQLCDPDPIARWPSVRGRSAIRGDGLEWLLRQADILIRRLDVGISAGSSYRRRRAS